MSIQWFMRRPVVACCGVLALAACGAPTGAPSQSSSTPPSSATVSPYTPSGTTLRVGQSAVVPWQDDLKPGNPVGMLRLAVTSVSDGELAGGAYPDPGTSPSFNDVTFLVRISTTSIGAVPVHPDAGLFGLIAVYDSNGDAMTPATTFDQSCAISTCAAYLGSVLAPHVARIVFDGVADPPARITWTNE